MNRWLKLHFIHTWWLTIHNDSEYQAHTKQEVVADLKFGKNMADEPLRWETPRRQNWTQYVVEGHGISREETLVF